MLTNRVVADAIYEYVCIGESIVIESMRRLVIPIVEVFKDGYLRLPNENNTTHLLAIGEERGFLGIDWMHWK